MRPINLKIRGLNSFNEEQNIDFEKLTSEGLFGIFGPTGSGKSTVLDGITLALYGDVSRKSSNFINTNCETLSVSFKFQITGSEVKRYVVEREFKRDKKTGSNVSGKCKILDVTSEEPIILADKVKDVTNTCREIIGLSLEDFTRTVVLPQGKFSEFLKLEGKARRDMLERLFNLQQYGDELAFKLKKEINKEETINSELSGELRGFEGISKEALKEKENQLVEINNKLYLVEEELKILEKKFIENQELWNLSVELKNHQDRKNIFEEKKNYFEEMKVSILKGESAQNIVPYITTHDNTLKELLFIKDNLGEINKRYTILKSEKEEIDQSFNQWRRKKDEDIPKLMVKQQQLTEAVEEERNISLLKSQIDGIKETVRGLSSKEEEFTNNLKVLEERLEHGIGVTKETEAKVEELQIDNNLKEAVQRGLLISGKYKDLKDRISANKLKDEALEKNLNTAKVKLEILNNKLLQKNEEIGKLKITQEEFIKSNPGTQEDLINLQRKVSEGAEAWKKYKSESKLIGDNEVEISNVENSIKSKEEERVKISREIEELKQRIKELQIEGLAHNLRESLNEGEICPVCGSREHHKEAIKAIDDGNLEKLEALEKEKNAVLKSVEKSIATYEAGLQGLIHAIEKSKKEVENLGEDFKLKTVEELQMEFNALNKSMEAYNCSKEKMDIKYNEIREEKLSLEGQINTTTLLIQSEERQLKDIREEYERDALNIKILEGELSEITASTGFNNFEEKNREFQLVEKERVEAEKKLKQCRSLMEDLSNNKVVIQDSLNKIKEELAKEKSSLEEREKISQEKENFLYKKIGYNVNAKEELTLVGANIDEIEMAYGKVSEKKDNLDKEFTGCNETLIGLIAKEREVEKRKDIEATSITRLLAEEGFKSIEEVKEYALSKDEIKEMKQQVEEYEDSMAKLLGAMENISKKISGRELSEVAWKECHENKKAKEEEVNNLKEEKVKVKNEENLIKRKLEELGDLLKKKEKLEHKLALLSDLEKLFKGKRFVEFVAANRLKYISMEASKKLKEISSGIYGLEVDENGRFIIRDYKNGGAERDASTLSGGETFLTSLALALALSSEIQLKGTAPLELFFLDEGFGTLDDNLLEVVMSSLEKIHNEKLKVGIISHVESIKNRVPVKLIITPAEAGKGGSKVSIEKS